MKKIFFCVLFVAFFSVQVAFGDTIDYEFSADPVIPVYKERSNKPIEVDIATFPYDTDDLQGDITAASISFKWGSTNINKLSQVDLYLNDTLIFDFGEYYSGLDKAEKKALKQGGTVPITITITDEAALAALEDGAILYLFGKPKFFKSLILLDDITLNITDPPEDLPPNGNGTPVPEPTTMLLLGAGLIGLWGLRKKIKK